MTIFLLQCVFHITTFKKLFCVVSNSSLQKYINSKELILEAKKVKDDSKKPIK